jgi:hypothetical protein
MSTARFRAQSLYLSFICYSLSIVGSWARSVGHFSPARWYKFNRSAHQVTFRDTHCVAAFTKPVLLRSRCSRQEIPFDAGGAEVFDADAGGFGGRGVAKFFLGGGELLEDEQGAGVSG